MSITPASIGGSFFAVLAARNIPFRVLFRQENNLRIQAHHPLRHYNVIAGRRDTATVICKKMERAWMLRVVIKQSCGIGIVPQARKHPISIGDDTLTSFPPELSLV